MVILLFTGIALSALSAGGRAGHSTATDLYLRTLIARRSAGRRRGERARRRWVSPCSSCRWLVLAQVCADRRRQAQQIRRNRTNAPHGRCGTASFRFGEDQGIPALSPTDLRLDLCRRAGRAASHGGAVRRFRFGRQFHRLGRRRPAIFEETRTFDFYLLGTFVALTFGLLLTTLFQVRFGSRR
ncbi:MAG: hypothetical protein R3D69_08455 [Xanthobacteraceae bacterium]